MDASTAMCELRERKQQSYNAVCCDFALNHNMEALAKRIGLKSGGMLRNKLNPEQPHVLNPVELALLCKESGDYTIINTLLGDLGVVTASVPVEEQAKSLVERLLEHTNLTGQLSGSVLALSQEHRYPRSQKRKTLATAQAALGNLVLLISDLENRTTGMSPLLSMGVDFVMNGAPIPGLA
ncbi:phage regulatory CII family protein [Vibrio aestuarianus]|uniref:Transcriptional regulator n=2 Tax=Vibrio aestuarianus TaxID=28171 RepID=A0ABM9FR89_9VIBR|nr:phage regulatory CII family protein [Vibrio aestuarianus]MDE1213792.1 phage regulatory CII family protein [Vibrio aestuarianus]MDE1217249.1 phage regulatory CII family protein [Vibrio aestuarianus]MDE1256990.1 phage regulatory CII family protein [Vibrio aestuarianus]MDE1260790.1 phage regulatory CII family protein [Vibrio aestuarianus]MDE1267586.1 phage regulatory CII family protein [Vibrio aestuarianus]